MVYARRAGMPGGFVDETLGAKMPRLVISRNIRVRAHIVAVDSMALRGSTATSSASSAYGHSSLMYDSPARARKKNTISIDICSSFLVWVYCRCEKNARREVNLVALERKEFRRQLQIFQKWQSENKELRQKVKFQDTQVSAPKKTKKAKIRSSRENNTRETTKIVSRETIFLLLSIVKIHPRTPPKPQQPTHAL